MVSIAQELTIVYGADRGIVAQAVLLHDLAGVDDISERELHLSFSAQRVREILAAYQYPADKTELVAQCSNGYYCE